VAGKGSERTGRPLSFTYKKRLKACRSSSENQARQQNSENQCAKREQKLAKKGQTDGKTTKADAEAGAGADDRRA
jgi:hypothetical protein